MRAQFGRRVGDLIGGKQTEITNLVESRARDEGQEFGDKIAAFVDDGFGATTRSTWASAPVSTETAAMPHRLPRPPSTV